MKNNPYKKPTNFDKNIILISKFTQLLNAQV